MLALVAPETIALVAVAARTIAGLVLLVAGLSKVIAVRRFVDAVWAYRLLPEAAVVVVGRALPWAEVIVGVTVIFGILLPWSALGALGLYMLFGTAIAINVVRGRRNIDCGCFGSMRREHLTWWLVGRNSALAGLAILGSNAIEPSATLAFSEMVAASLTAGAALAIWWLSLELRTLWRVPV